MAWEKGQSGNPNGRPKGARNIDRGRRGTSGVSARERSRLIAQSEVKPLSVMMDILAERWKEALAAKNPKARKALQMEACAVAEKVAPYLHPKLQATTIKGDQANPLSFVHNLPKAEELYRSVRGDPEKDQE